MLTIDIDILLQAVSADNPAGDNLEYDPAFLELERAAQPKAEQQIGGAVIPGEPFNPKVVHQQAVELCGRTKDLRIACFLAQALAYAGGFRGLAQGLAFIHGLVEQYWASVHPQLDPEDDNDPTMRVTALTGLTTPEMLSALRHAPLITSRSFGAIGLREIAIANGELPQPKEGPKYDTQVIEGAFQEIDLEELETLTQALTQVQTLLQTIETAFDAHASMAPDFAPVKRALLQALNAVRPRFEARKAELEAAQAEAQAAVDDNSLASPQARRATTGEISSREDVLRVLDKLCAYYAKHEPSSPLPLLLKRCQRLVPMSFKEIVGDLAPDALSKVELIAGKSDD
jgi:type VI secretion system protein ImpA